MHVVQRVPRQRTQRRIYLASERQVVNGVGLGELEGIKLKKAFSRLVKVKKSSFKLKNIMGSIGSAAMFTGTMGLSSVVAPKATGAHSKLARGVGIGVTAVAAAAGAVIAAPVVMPALASAGTAVGGALSSVGGALMTGLKALPILSSVMGGKGGSGGIVQQEADPYAQAYAQQQGMIQQQMAQQAYEQEQARLSQIQQQQSQMYLPAAYRESLQAEQYPSMNTSYGDLRSPYTAITESGEQVQVDPTTGQIIQAGVLPDLSMTTWLAIGGATLAGWYFLSDSKSTN